MFALAACNPFAPEIDEGDAGSVPIVTDHTTIDGVFQNFRYAYSFQDTTIYGELLHPEFTFTYTDYDKSIDVSWGRDEEMSITSRLFDNAQSFNLVWNNIVSQAGDTLQVNVTRSFNLTVTFSANDIVRVDGRVNLDLVRPRATDPWRILNWRDESNF